MLVDYIYVDMQTLPEIVKLFEVALRFTDLSQLPNIYIVKSILQFFNDFSNEYKNNFSLSMQVMQFCFNYIDNKDLQSISADIFRVVTASMKQAIPQEFF